MEKQDLILDPKGSNKSQILKWIKDEEIHFFGDAMHPGGNDEPIEISITGLSQPKMLKCRKLARNSKYIKRT